MTHSLYISRFTPWIDQIEEYDAIGSGELYAKLLLRQQRRMVPYGSDTLDYNVWTCMLQLSRDQAKFIYNQYRDFVANELSIKLGITKERALGLFPEP